MNKLLACVGLAAASKAVLIMPGYYPPTITSMEAWYETASEYGFTPDQIHDNMGCRYGLAKLYIEQERMWQVFMQVFEGCEKGIRLGGRQNPYAVALNYSSEGR